MTILLLKNEILKTNLNNLNLLKSNNDIKIWAINKNKNEKENIVFFSFHQFNFNLTINISQCRI